MVLYKHEQREGSKKKEKKGDGDGVVEGEKGRMRGQCSELFVS